MPNIFPAYLFRSFMRKHKYQLSHREPEKDYFVFGSPEIMVAIPSNKHQFTLDDVKEVLGTMGPDLLIKLEEYIENKGQLAGNLEREIEWQKLSWLMEETILNRLHNALVLANKIRTCKVQMFKGHFLSDKPISQKIVWNTSLNELAYFINWFLIDQNFISEIKDNKAVITLQHFQKPNGEINIGSFSSMTGRALRNNASSFYEKLAKQLNPTTTTA